MLRLNCGISYFFALVFFMAAQDRPANCEGRDNRHRNMVISALQQYFFGVAATFLLAEAFATFRAITAGVIGGRKWGFIVCSWGAPLFNVGLTLFLHGDNYGTDPRCFVGWENETKNVFFYHHLVVCGVGGDTIIWQSLIVIANPFAF